MNSWGCIVGALILTLQCWCSEFGHESWICASDSDSSNSESVSETHRMCRCSVTSDGLIDRKTLNCSYRDFAIFQTGLILPYNLIRLDLSGNSFSFLEDAPFGRVIELEELSLRGNNLIKLSENSLSGLTSLKTLDLSQNVLEKLPEKLFSNQVNLKELNLRANDLRYLPRHMFKNVTQIDILSISCNTNIGQYIHDSEDALKDIFRKGLRHLEMDHVNLTHIPENFFNEAYRLQELHISSNPLSTVPGLYMGSLEVLYMRDTNLSAVETASFLTIPNLRVLYMDMQPNLTFIEEGAFVGLKHLKTLSLERCHNLTSFSELAFGGSNSSRPSLHRFSIVYGGFQTLSKGLLPLLQHVEELELYANPWNCDCNLRWLKQLNISEENKRHTRCYFPKGLRHKRISTLRTSQFQCRDKKTMLMSGLLITMAIAFALVGTVVIIAIIGSIRQKIAQRYASRSRYEPMVVHLDPNSAENYWEDPDQSRPLSIIRTS